MQGEVIGATFAKTLPVGAVSAPIKTDESVFVIRVDKRTTADSTKWLSQKLTQRENLLQVLRDQKIRLYLDALKKAAKIDDKRKALQAAQRRASS
jgi:parvulin-like peptidyl-prolyl isomerase